jgi:hypothetical protein
MPIIPKQLTDQATRHAVHVEGFKNSAVKEYKSLLKKMEKSVLAELNSDITEWNRRRLRKKLTAIAGAIKDTATPIDQLFSKQVSELALFEAEFEVKSLNNVLVNYDFDLPSDNQIKAAVLSRPIQAAGPYKGQLLATMTEDWTASTIKRVNGAIRLGFANGTTTTQLIRDMQAAGGAFELSARELNNVVRTGLAHSANTARQSVWEQNEEVVVGYRIRATLDSLTTTLCRSIDEEGKIRKVGDDIIPPLHTNCRDYTEAALDDRFSMLDEGGTRFARDPETGKVETAPANQGYYSWLKTQPAKVQDSIVGPTRGKLLRNGGISAERFAELQIGKNFTSNTIEEMRKLEPIAFEKANV